MTDITIEWARCQDWIQAAVNEAEGLFLIEDIASGVEQGLFQFWPGEKCAAISEIITFPRAKAMNIILVGGDMNELLDMIPSWEAFAKYMQCDRITGGGRIGWNRFLKQHGFKVVGRVEKFI